MLFSLKVINKEKVVKLSSKTYTQIMIANIAQNLSEKTWIKVINSSCKQKDILFNIPKVEPKKR